MSRRILATYIIYYTDKTGEPEGCEAYGYKQLMDMIKWLHSEEIKAIDISIYKHGENFENDHDDIVEAYKRFWK